MNKVTLAFGGKSIEVDLDAIESHTSPDKKQRFASLPSPSGNLVLDASTIKALSSALDVRPRNISKRLHGWELSVIASSCIDNSRRDILFHMIISMCVCTSATGRTFLYVETLSPNTWYYVDLELFLMQGGAIRPVSRSNALLTGIGWSGGFVTHGIDRAAVRRTPLSSYPFFFEPGSPAGIAHFPHQPPTPRSGIQSASTYQRRAEGSAPLIGEHAVRGLFNSRGNALPHFTPVLPPPLGTQTPDSEWDFVTPDNQMLEEMEEEEEEENEEDDA
jgi:hypothetical protein